MRPFGSWDWSLFVGKVRRPLEVIIETRFDGGEMKLFSFSLKVSTCLFVQARKHELSFHRATLPQEE